MLPRLALALVLTFSALLPAASAQDASAPATYTFVIRGAPLDEALQELARRTQIDLVYRADLVQGQRSYCVLSGTAEAILRCLLADTGLDFVRSSSGAYVLIQALEQPPQVGHVAGRVVDGLTGEPLPSAHVLLADASAGTVTNEGGYFSFGGVLSGPHALRISYLGYTPRVDSVWVEPGNQARLQIRLEPQQLVFEPVVIDGLVQHRPSADLGLAATEAWGDLAGLGTTDLAFHAARLPGVSSQQPVADLNIQGGASGEHLTTLDGVPIRNPVSLGRHLGAFSPLAVERLTIHKAGFGAEQGSHLAGVVAVTHDLSGEAPVGGALSLDPVSLNAQGRGRWALGPGRDATVMAAARTSLWDAYEDGGIQRLLSNWSAADPLQTSLWLGEPVTPTSLTRTRQIPTVRFSDLHLAGRVQRTPFHTISGSAYRAENRLGSDLSALYTPPAADSAQVLVSTNDYAWTNWAGQVTSQWLLGSRSMMTVQAHASWHRSSYRYRLRRGPAGTNDPAQLDALEDELRLDIRPGGNERHRLAEGGLAVTWHHSPTPRHHLTTGLEAAWTQSRLTLDQPLVAPLRHDADGTTVAAHATSALNLTPTLRVEPSLRLTWVPVRQAVLAEPRLSVRHDRSLGTRGALALRLAGGLYRQYVQAFELTSVGVTAVVPAIHFWLPTSADVAPPRAYHASAEALLTLTSGWRVTLEGYYKAQPRLLDIDYVGLIARPEPDAGVTPSVTQDDLVRVTRGEAVGGLVRLHHAGRLVRPTATYSYSWATRRYPHQGRDETEPVPWNQPHRLLLDAEVPLTDGLRLSTRWTGVWGRRWALRRMYYDYLRHTSLGTAETPFGAERPGRQALPVLRHLDLGVTLETPFQTNRVQVRLFVINVFDRINVFDQNLAFAEGVPTVPVDRMLPGRHVAFSVRVTR